MITVYYDFGMIVDLPVLDKFESLKCPQFVTTSFSVATTSFSVATTSFSVATTGFSRHDILCLPNCGTLPESGEQQMPVLDNGRLLAEMFNELCAVGDAAVGHG